MCNHQLSFHMIIQIVLTIMVNITIMLVVKEQLILPSILHLLVLMVVSLMEAWVVEWDMVLVNVNGQMVQDIRAIGIKMLDMVTEYSLQEMEWSMKVNG